MSSRATYWSVSVLLSAVVLLAASCQHDEVKPEPDTPAPTAYNLAADVPAGFPSYTVPADNPLTNEGVALGRMLFYEKALSRNNAMSCGSCHQQSKAFTDGRALAVGVDGTANTRGAMSLANVLWSSQLQWDGAFTQVERQAQHPIENAIELHQSLADGVAKLQATSTYPKLFKAAFGTSTITSDLALKALAQFERTLISGNSRYDRYTRTRTGFSTDELAGMVLYNTHIVPSGPRTPGTRGAECFHCHTQPLMSSNYEGKFFNNGLDLTFADNGRGIISGLAADNGKFIAPTLRNIALTAPYMHDGRFKTLEEVLDHYSDHVQMASPGLEPFLVQGINDPINNPGHMGLTATEKRQVIAFLKTLTDSTFINNPKFAAP